MQEMNFEIKIIVVEWLFKVRGHQTYRGSIDTSVFTLTE
jgi:hypothetical protein